MARKIGALWLRESKDGKKYMSGILEDLHGDIRIAVFKNDRKEKKNQPDYQIILSGDSQDRKNNNGNESNNGAEEVNLDDIPF